MPDLHLVLGYLFPVRRWGCFSISCSWHRIITLWHRFTYPAFDLLKRYQLIYSPAGIECHSFHECGNNNCHWMSCYEILWTRLVICSRKCQLFHYYYYYYYYSSSPSCSSSSFYPILTEINEVNSMLELQQLPYALFIQVIFVHLW